MATQRLTKTFIEGANHAGTFRDDQIPGFCLRVTRSGVKSFLFVAKPKDSKKNVSVTIGRVSRDLNLERARQRALELRLEFRQGKNPNLELKKEVAARQQAYTDGFRKLDSITLHQAFQDYLRFRPLKPSTQANCKYVMKHLSDWMLRPIESISKNDVKERHQDIANMKNGGGDGSANNTMRVLRAILNFAALHHEHIYNESRPLLNPVPVLGKLKMWKKIGRRQSVVQEADLCAWAKAVESLDSEVARDLLIFLAFTGLRKNEAASLRWADVNFKQRIIWIRNTKNSHPLCLPLSDFLLALLQRREKYKGEYVFSGENTYYKNIAYHLDKTEELAGISCMPHDLRRTFLTVATRAGVPEYILKRLVNHRNTNDVTEGYLVLNVEDLRESMEKITDRLLRFCYFYSDSTTPC